MQTNKLREQGSKGNSIEKNTEGDTTGAKLLLVDAIVRIIFELCIEWRDCRGIGLLTVSAPDIKLSFSRNTSLRLNRGTYWEPLTLDKVGTR